MYRKKQSVGACWMCYAAAIGASIVGRTSAPGVVRVAGCKGFERLWYYNSWAKMSKRKGMSLDEKRVKLLEVFHDSADVFVLKVCVWGAGCACSRLSPCTCYSVKFPGLMHPTSAGC